MENFASWLYSRMPTPGTHKLYVFLAGKYLRWLDGREPGKQTTLEFVQHLRDTAHAAGTERLYVCCLKWYGKFLGRELVNGLRPRRLPRQLPDPLTHEEIGRLFSRGCCKTPGLIQLRNLAMLSLLYYAGLRLGELASLRVDQVDLKAGMVRVMGKGMKERLVPITSDAVRSVRAYLSEAARIPGTHVELWVRLDGKPMKKGGVFSALKVWAERAGLARWHPHRMRHTFATELLNRGANLRSIQELMGHAHLSATEVYTLVSVEKMRQEYAKYHPLKFRGVLPPTGHTSEKKGG